MGRRVEETLLHVAVTHARAHGAATLVADYRATARNTPCLDFFRRCGFRAASDSRFIWETAKPYELPGGVTLRG